MEGSVYVAEERLRFLSAKSCFSCNNGGSENVNVTQHRVFSLLSSCFQVLVQNALILKGFLQVERFMLWLLSSTGLHLSFSIPLQKTTYCVHLPEAQQR